MMRESIPVKLEISLERLSPGKLRLQWQDLVTNFVYLYLALSMHLTFGNKKFKMWDVKSKNWASFLFNYELQLVLSHFKSEISRTHTTTTIY